MCENDITFAPTPLTPKQEAYGKWRDTVPSLATLPAWEVFDAGYDAGVAASRLTRKQLEDVAALLFVLPSGAEGYCLDLMTGGRINGRRQPMGRSLTRDDVAAILADALLPKEETP